MLSYGMTRTRMRELHDQLQGVLHAEMGILTGRVELFINQGGVQNRDISPAGKAAIKEGLRRYCESRGWPPAQVGGRIPCNLAEGRLKGLPLGHLRLIN